jgi:DNA-binding NarL/FixJ family response regulator
MKAREAKTILKVVIVQDSSIIVGRIKGMLSEVSGVEFAGNVSTIPAALELISVTRPDVIILDIHLQGWDQRNGIDLLVMIRPIYPAMKVIMLTNLADNRYRTMCQNAGADYFFDKSNDFDKIPDTLNKILDEKRFHVS